MTLSVEIYLIIWYNFSIIKKFFLIKDYKKMSDSYKFFSHKECEFFPCHKTDNEDDFNCLFCYCPLYFLGSECGGNFTLTEKGIKNCTGCMIPHKRKNYDYIINRLKNSGR